MKTTLLIFSLLLWFLVGPTRADVTFADLFYLAPAEAERSFGAERFGMLRDAVEDFNAVVNFKPPIHARLDQEAPVPADGGTEFYQGRGYRLTVTKSLFTLGGSSQTAILGYMYGPVLTLLPELGVGNSQNLSHVSFYTLDVLNRALKH